MDCKTILSIAFSAAVFAVCGVAWAQEEQPPAVVFRVEVDYVEVDAIVTDANGNFISQLGIEDFEILEEGKRQTIESFALVEIPTSSPEVWEEAPAVLDVQTNLGLNEARIYVLVFDDLHTRVEGSAQLRAAALKFIEERIGGNDLTAVFCTSGRPGTLQGFTTDRRLLQEVVDRFLGRKLPVSMHPEPEQARKPERAYDAINAFSTLRNIAQSLREVTGRRKVIVYFSEGIDYDIEHYEFGNFGKHDPRRSAVFNAMVEAIGSANRSNVTIYGLNTRGLTAADDSRAITNLRTLSGETGGFAIVNQNDLESGMARIVRESSRYYLLGYSPTNKKRDGEYRRIEVRVKKPGLQVRARKGYLAPTAEDAKTADLEVSGVEALLVKALQSPIPLSGIPLRAVTTVFRLPEKRFRVAVLLDIDIVDFRMEEKDGKLHDDVNVAVLALDESGDVSDSTGRTIHLALEPEDYSKHIDRGLRTMTNLSLAPGDYTLAVAVREAGGGRIGSLYTDLRILEPSQGVNPSEVVLSSAREAWIPVVAVPEEQEGFLFLPSTRRDFRQDDDLLITAAVDVSPVRVEDPVVEVSSTLRARDGTVLSSLTEEMNLSDQSTKNRLYQTRLPLYEIGPGEYVLELVVRQRTGGSEASRHFFVRVVP